MLHEFLSANRQELIDRCSAKVALRGSPQAGDDIQEHGIPFFIDQLIKTLQIEQTVAPMRSREVSGQPTAGKPELSEMGETATLHGGELLRRGYTIEEVVHDYGNLCQSVTDLAFERNEPFSIDEFRTLNRYLDDVIAVAVTEFSCQRDFVTAAQHSQALNERLGFFAHEIRNLINTATLALTVLKSGKVGFSGATGGVLDRSLVGLRNLVDRSLTDVRITAGLPTYNVLFSLADFIGELKHSASLEAKVRGCTLVVSYVDPKLAVFADRESLFAAAGNVLQNALKFTKAGTEVTLTAYAVADRILIDVGDNCGGLPAGAQERMFQPFVQVGKDRSGLGLGLAIAKQSVEANQGTLTVRDVPDFGCVISLNLPRHLMPIPPYIS